MAYIKLSDMKYPNKKHKTVVEMLHKDIISAEKALLYFEKKAYELMKDIGSERAIRITLPTIQMQQNIIDSLKTTFWYYTGINSYDVVSEEETKDVDIFNV